MKTKNLNTNLERICLFVLLVALFSSCEFTPGYYVEQEIKDSSYHNRAFLKTIVWHRGYIIQYWSDEITLKTPDTLKLYRLKQANEFIEKCKSIEACCNN